MNINLKATLLSALLIPGSGQLSLGKKSKAYVLIVLSLIFTGILFYQINLHVLEVARNLAAQGSSDFAMLNDEARKIIANLDNPAFNTAKYGIIIVWLYAVLDAAFSKTKDP